MISKRNYIVLSLMMCVILFLFLFSTVLSDVYNDYDVNHYASRDEVVSTKIENDDDADSETAHNSVKQTSAIQTVLLAGEESKVITQKAREWANYRNLSFQTEASIKDAVSACMDGQAESILLLVDGSLLESGTDASANRLSACVKKGATVVLMSLPSSTAVRESDALRNLLGIQNVRSEQIGLKEIRLYEGFLLGGEMIYSFTDDSKVEQMDLARTIPWYDISSGTKTYMVGIISDADKNAYGVQNEDMPAIIWRNSDGNGFVFAVNGSYMNGDMAYGVLDSIVYESYDYELHAIVNAQNLVLAAYPNLTNENGEQMSQRYGYNMRQFCMEILWPSLDAAAQKNDWRMTSMISVAQSANSGGDASLKDWTEYMKYLNQLSSEAGVTLGRRDSTALHDEILDDLDVLSQTGKDYLYTSAYIRSSDRTSLLDEISSEGTLASFDEIRTVVMDRDENQPVLSWLTDKITMQSPTIDGFSHTYYENLSLRSLETALGYSNILVDMDRVLWPQSTEDEWQNVSRKFSSYIDTYWKPFSAFEKTTLSESDKRVRRFLNEKVTSSREDNTISIKVDNFDTEAWLMLRTHGEGIDQVEGGDWQEIEKNAYLIHLTSDTASVDLTPWHALYYYSDTEEESK